MPEPAHWRIVGFGSTSALFLLIGITLALRAPFKPMLAFAEIFILTATMPALFYYLTEVERGKAKQLGGIASCVIWVAGIALAVMIPPSSNFIYLPDALLLLGFFPLLYLWKYSWPWIVFGLLNVGIGILLQVIEYSPDHLFPADLLKPKHHLAEYHPAVCWWFIGIIATTFGFGRATKNIALMIKRRSAQPE